MILLNSLTRDTMDITMTIQLLQTRRYRNINQIFQCYIVPHVHTIRPCSDIFVTVISAHHSKRSVKKYM